MFIEEKVFCKQLVFKAARKIALLIENIKKFYRYKLNKLI